MLENIREGVKKPWVKLVVFAIVISFVFAGYFSSSFFLGDPNAVAIVNGESISRTQFQRAYDTEKVRRADFYNASVKTEEDERKFQEGVLQSLITQTVVKQAVQDLGLRLSTDKLREVIQSFEAFKGPDGKYSADVLKQRLAQINMSRETLKSDFAYQETYRHLSEGISSTDFALPSEVKSDYALLAQKRSGKVLKLNLEQFKNSIDVTPEQLESYYQENQEAFRVEEKVSVEYLELSIDKLKESQQPTAEEVALYYAENKNRYQGLAQRRYSHILILSGDDSDAAKDKATKAEQELKQGVAFEDVAKKYADESGDLGYLIAGVLEPVADEAVASLEKVGDHTPVVEIEDGFQILQLTELQPGSVQTLAEVEGEILEELKTIQAEQEFYAKAELLKEKSFEFADSLVEASQAIGIDVEVSPLFGRSERSGIFANAEVKDAAFSSDVKEAKLNSPTIDLGDNHILVLRVKDVKPSFIQPLDEVKARVEKSVLQTQAKQQASELANQLLVALEKGESVESLLSEKSLAWSDLDNLQRNNAKLSYQVSQEFFKMPEPAEGTVKYKLVEDFQGFAILMLNEVKPGVWEEAEEAMKKQRELYLQNYFANASFNGFIEAYRQSAEVTRNLDNLIQ